jgi:hypothetical protein
MGAPEDDSWKDEIIKGSFLFFFGGEAMVNLGIRHDMTATSISGA